MKEKILPRVQITARKALAAILEKTGRPIQHGWITERHFDKRFFKILLDDNGEEIEDPENREYWLSRDQFVKLGRGGGDYIN